MSIENKREILARICRKNNCDDCILTRGEWKKTLRTKNCLDIADSDAEDIDKAIKLIGESEELDVAHDINKLIDSVNNPSHYTDGKIEVIDYIEDKKLGFCLGNAIKYISRAGKKDKDKEAEDINKAIWYLNRYLKQLEEA